MSSLLAPAVSRSAVSSMSRHPSSDGSSTSCSSNSTRPPREPMFTGAHGTMCFCPLSAIAANHRPDFGARSHARIAALLPLLTRR